MDKLLQKLRQNMAELSLQGDDFTRQIWQMYATFEEFIDHQQSPEDGSPPRHPTQDAPPPPPAPSGGLGTVPISPTRDATSPYSRVSPTMSVIAASSVSLPNTSARLRQKSPSTTSDDLALASPRRSRRRRPRRLRRSVDNPLLDTISTIGGDSDEDPLHHHIYHSHSHNLHLQPHSPVSCPRLHLETDIIGYAGSNSVDSGYKSACPTPDLPDLIYPEHRLEKRGSLASLVSSGSSGGSNTGSKPRIPMGTRVMSRGGGIPRSPGTGVVTPTKRPGSDSSYYESDQLVALRQALLGSPTEGEGISLSGTRYSPRVSPATTLPLNLGTSQRDYHVSRRAASPASPERRPRSASTGSRCSPGAKGKRKALQSGSPHLASTGSLPRATSPGRRPSLSPAGRDDNRPPPVWSRHSSPGMSTSGGRGRRPPSPIVGVDQVHESELALLEREIDVLLYGGRGAQYYDLESGREFPCPFSNNQEATPHACRPALASIRKLREEVRGARISLLVNESSCHGLSETAVPSPKEVELKSKATAAAGETTISTIATTTTATAMTTKTIATTTTTTTTIEATCSIVITTKLTATTTTTTSCQASSDNTFIVNLIGFSSDNARGLTSFDVAKCALNDLGMLGEIPKNDTTKSCNGVQTSEEVLNDLQSSFHKSKYRTTPYPLKSLPCLSDESNSESSSYSDYHLYEEILYDTSKKLPTDNPRPPSPPPLPKRPPLFQKYMLEFRGEVGAQEKCSMIGNAVKETLVRPSLKCCRCPGEIITRKQVKKGFSKKSAKLKYKNQGNQSVKNNNSFCLTICDNQVPPVPPIRTTSQMSHHLLSSKVSVPPAPPFSSPSIASSTVSVSLLNGSSSHKSVPFIPSRTSSNLRDMSSSQNNDQSLKDSYKEIFSTDCNISSSNSMATQTSKPKQRHNLYSIFKDKHHRRFLSASLELEYHHQPELTKDNEESKSKETRDLAHLGKAVSVTRSDNERSGISESTKLICSSTLNSPQPTSSEIVKDSTTSLKKCDSNPQRISLVDSQITIASEVCDNPLILKRKSNGIRVCQKACSLDLNQTAQVDDEYGFQALSNVV